eukprot:TRINITY_DN3467_c0_g2_i1.p1 TRINITY_DN3467_c0_g2~~TRINITY_DN3467_c0_g2_i1.p1  ORF type:complete len:154 (-),score=5.23 TRINITY_DN3467_c0_g2_i1:77-538(-)
MNHGVVVVAAVVVGMCLSGCDTSSSSAYASRDRAVADCMVPIMTPKTYCGGTGEVWCSYRCPTALDDPDSIAGCCQCNYFDNLAICESDDTMSDFPYIQRLVLAQDVLGFAGEKTSAPVGAVAVGVAAAGISGALVAAAFASWTSKQSIALSN